jgi:uncharacterized membrane protein
MVARVIKGVDEEIEFKGFKGRYFYLLAGVILSLLLLTFLCYMFGFSSFLLILFDVLLGVGAYMYLKFSMDKNGKWGHIHSQHQNRKPKHLLHDKPFYKLIK